MSEVDNSAIGGEEFPPDAKTLVFCGISGRECEHFIRSVRFIALAEEKDEDDRWMLRFATVRLSGRAMRWHARLDKEIRKDWDLLVQALLDEYPMHHEETPDVIVSAAPIVTPVEAPSQVLVDPSTSPLPQGSILSPGLNVGRLRIVPLSGHANALYISKDIAITTIRADALHVQFLQSAAPHRIGMIGWNRMVTTQLRLYVPGFLLAVSGTTICSSASASDAKENLDCWRVGSNGVVGTTNSAHDGHRLLINLSTQCLRFAQDPPLFIQTQQSREPGTYYEARLVFEQLGSGEQLN